MKEDIPANTGNIHTKQNNLKWKPIGDKEKCFTERTTHEYLIDITDNTR